MFFHCPANAQQSENIQIDEKKDISRLGWAVMDYLRLAGILIHVLCARLVNMSSITHTM